MSDVAIVSCETYEEEKVKKAIELIIGKTGFPDVKNKSVLLKPNILSDAITEKAITTNPVVLSAMIQIVKERGAAKIFVGDSPSIQKKHLEPTNCGIFQVCEKEAVEWVDFTKDPIKKKLPYVNHSIYMAAILDNVDIVINLPKFKTHELMLMTGAVKNLFGTVPGLRKSPMHVRHPSRGSFAKLVCGVFSQCHVDYALMDGIVGMEGAGPANGKPRNVGLLLGSSDCVALDIAAATIMGYNPLSIPVNVFALKVGLTPTTNIDEITYPLINPRSIILSDFLRCGGKKIEEGDNENFTRKPPTFIHETCIQCGRCIEICPAQAIVMKDKKVILTPEKCIRCYCCHEVCPVGAIEIDRDTE